MLLRKKFKEMASGERLLAGYEFLSIGAKPEQNLHLQQLEGYVSDGVAEVGKDSITLKFLNGDKVFKVIGKPGIYCLFDDKVFPLDGPDVAMINRGKVARDYIAKNHAGKKSPDPSNPSGYAVRPYYATRLEQ